MEIQTFKKKIYFFLKIGIFFFKIGKKAPKFHWEWGRISAPENTKNIPDRADPDFLFVCFVALRPKSTAMVMAGRSVHLTTLFPGQA